MKRNGGEFGTNPIGDPPLPHETVWKGPDLKTTGEDKIVLSGSTLYITVLVNPANLPDLTELDPTKVKPSTKSKLAQLGLEVDESVGRWIVVQAKENFEKEGVSRPFEMSILTKNHSLRPIIIESGSPLFRLYIPGSYIEGESLKNLMESGQIEIDGNRGKEWDYVYPHVYPRTNPYGLAVRLNSGKKLWIPSGENNEPLSVREVQQAANYRDYLRTKYKPVPRTADKILWIGETVIMKLSPGIDAELEKTVFPNLVALKGGESGSQIAARLIDGGKTEWEVRVEVLGPTDSEVANYAVFRFMHS